VVLFCAIIRWNNGTAWNYSMELHPKSVPREVKELLAMVAQGKRDIAAGNVYEVDAVLEELEQLVVSTYLGRD
jgi:hypothetical protein